MKRRLLVAAWALCVSSPAVAAKRGDLLYVKARNTRLMASASPTANVVTILQPGQKVTWRGADPKNKQWHLVEVDGKKGLVFQSNLSTTPPRMELVATKGERQVDPVAFAHSGAASKGLSQGAIDYGKKKGEKDLDFKTAVNQLQSIEDIAKDVSPRDISKHAEQARLFPVVGPAETVSQRGK